MGANDVNLVRLQAENFGPIARADVELRPLTIFVGPSGCGKSYLAKLLYALHQLFLLQRPFHRKGRTRTNFRKLADATSGLPAIVEWLEDHLTAPGGGRDTSYPDGLEALAREAAKAPGTMGTVFGNELRRVFGAEIMDDLILKPEAKAGFVLSHSSLAPPGSPPQFRYRFTMVPGKLTCSINVRKDAPMRLQGQRLYRLRARRLGLFGRKSPGNPDPSPINYQSLQAVLAGLVQPGTVGPISRPAYYLPASRSGGVEIQQVVVDSLLEGATIGRGRGGPTDPLSGVLRDYIGATFVHLSAKSAGSRIGRELANQIEQNILRGSVRIEEAENGASSIRYRPRGWDDDLPLVRASSMETEIIPVVLYLRHRVRRGSTLIIEEPEAHMHPAMQIRLAVELARIVASGVRVVITVHSDWILSALANIVRMEGLSSDQRRDLLGGDVKLPASQVGVWEFSDGDAGTVTRELRLDSENGMFEAGYPGIAETLYDDWATIHSRLQED